MELGAKVAWFKETKHRPQIGSFTMFELPTGSPRDGLGVGLQEDRPLGPRRGAGYVVNPQSGYRNYSYGGFLVERNLNKRLDLSLEVFSHAQEGLATPQTRPRL